MAGIARRYQWRIGTAAVGVDAYDDRCFRRLPWLTLALFVAACGSEDVAVRGPERAADTATAATQELPSSTVAETIEADGGALVSDIVHETTDATIEDGVEVVIEVDGNTKADSDVITEFDGGEPVDTDDAEVALVCAATDCDDGNGCTADSCDEVMGCVHLPQQATCEVDGDACTVDACAAGVCAVTGKVKECSDGNPCTTDACKQGGCVSVPAPDGAVCKGGDIADLALIPAGETAVGCTGLIGQPVDAGCHWSVTPPIIVYVSAFRIQRHEATAAQFEECVAAGVCSKPSKAELLAKAKSGWNEADFLSYCAQFSIPETKLPMNCVTPGQAWTFCQWLGGRFPTDAEYDKAMRGGCETVPAGKSCKDDTPLWPWGTGKATHGKEGVSLFKEMLSAPSEQLCGGTICPVGFAPGDVSPYGVHDLYGSLDEFVAGEPKIPPYFYSQVWDDWPYKDPPTVKAMACKRRGSGLFAPSWPSYLPMDYPSCSLEMDPAGNFVVVDAWMSTSSGFRCVLPVDNNSLP